MLPPAQDATRASLLPKKLVAAVTSVAALPASLIAFKTAAGDYLDDRALIQAITDFIQSDDRFDYRVLVGTDSEVQEGSIDFVSAIVVHRVGRGARYFWRRTIVTERFELRQRLWEEALMSLDVSQQLLELLHHLDGSFRFELHLDLGTVGKSHSVVREITNMVRSYGVAYKLKPESYAASKIADRLI